MDSWAKDMVILGRFHKKNQSLIQLSAYEIHESLTFDEARITETNTMYEHRTLKG